MLKLSAMLATTTALLSLSGTALAADKTTVNAESILEHGKNGGYKKTDSVENTNSTGTVKNESETKLKVSNDGSTEKTTTTEHSNDPKGLMNKHTEENTLKEKDKDGRITREHIQKVDGKTVYDNTSDKAK
jgi:hypothetical protein